jgi:hypothetical protein
MRQKRVFAILGTSLVIGVASSAGTCIIPRDLSRAAAAYSEDRSPENFARYERAVERGAFAEHVWVAVIATTAIATALFGVQPLWRFWLWLGEG